MKELIQILVSISSSSIVAAIVISDKTVKDKNNESINRGLICELYTNLRILSIILHDILRI